MQHGSRLGGWVQGRSPDLGGARAVPIGLLQACYDGDILTEEVITAWGQKPSKKYLDKETAAAVRKFAQPILDWLAYVGGHRHEQGRCPRKAHPRVRACVLFLTPQNC